MIRMVRELPPIPMPPNEVLESLSPREREVFALLSRGYMQKEIAYALARSIKTIDNHVRRLFLKCGVTTQAALVRVAFELGFAQPGVELEYDYSPDVAPALTGVRRAHAIPPGPRMSRAQAERQARQDAARQLPGRDTDVLNEYIEFRVRQLMWGKARRQGGPCPSDVEESMIRTKQPKRREIA
jgi:DNA-binding CsgD family transcriptional regulator